MARPRFVWPRLLVSAVPHGSSHKREIMMASTPMTKRPGWLTRVLGVLLLGLAFSGVPLAQTQTTTSVNVRHFEVIAVDGNRIVVRDERGTNEYTVPAGFRFTVDGKKMAASELKPGMKGTATVTTTTTVTPVVVTEIRHGVVVKASVGSVTVLDDTDHQRKKFTHDQLTERGLKIYRDGRVVTVSELNKGDEISATVISKRPPEIVTEQEVDATLVKTEPAKPEPVKAEPMPAKTESMANTAAPVVAQATTPPETPPATAAAPEPAPVRSSGIGTMGYAIVAVVIAALMFMVMRRRKDAD